MKAMMRRSSSKKSPSWTEEEEEELPPTVPPSMKALSGKSRPSMKSLSSFSSKSSKSRRPSADFDDETVPPTMKSLSMKSRPSMRSFSSKSSKSSSEELLPPAEVTVEVPYGFRAGDLLTVALPNSKKTTTLVIPEGCGPGSTLKVEPEVTVSVS